MLQVGGTGPQPIPAGHGRKVLTQTEPFRLVSLDAAAFDWLWRLVENRAVQHQLQASQGGIHEIQADVSRRAVIAFREAAGTLNGQPPKGKRRRLVRTPKK